MNFRALKLGAVAALAMTMGITALPAHAADNTVVTESDVTRQAENTPPTDNWVLYTRNAGAAEFVDGPATPPSGSGSLQLTTPTGADKVYLFNYDHVGEALASVDAIGYSTYRVAGSLQQDAALNLEVDYNGPDVAGGFTTLVFEPVYNTDQGAVVSGAWQTWDAYNGENAKWWSTKNIPGVCSFDCFVSWNEIVAANPDATILGGVGVNQGSGNPALTTNVDAFTFGQSTYDFERIRDADGDGTADTPAPTDKDQCKKDGYKTFNNPSFSNQGQCVSFVAAHKG